MPSALLRSSGNSASMDFPGLRRPDIGVLNSQRDMQFLFANGVLMTTIEVRANNNDDDGQRDTAIADHLRAMFGDVVYSMFDFEGELVAFQLFSGKSIH